MQYRIAFEDSYHPLISRARQLVAQEFLTRSQIPINSAEAINTQPVATNGNTAGKPYVKLPNIDLPKFDSSYERKFPFGIRVSNRVKYSAFIDTTLFESVFNQ